MHVLVMTEYWQSALACIESFGRRGHAVSVLTERHLHPHSRSLFVKQSMERPFTADLDASARQLIDIIAQWGVDLVVPISDGDALIAACAKETIGSPAIVSASLDAVRTVRDRGLTASLCHKLGVGAPRGMMAEANGDAHAAAGVVGYPLFVKLSDTSASSGVFFARTPGELDQVLYRLPRNARIQLQQQIIGDCVGCTGFALAGELKASFAFEKEYRFSLGGISPYTVLSTDPQAADALAAITRRLNWTGGIDIDFVRNPDGDLLALEINPRLSGTAIFPLKRGLDLPAQYLDALAGTQVAAAPVIPPVDADGFISVPEEVAYISGDPSRRQAEGAAFRQAHRCADSTFWDDAPLSQAMFGALLQVVWTTPRA